MRKPLSILLLAALFLASVSLAAAESAVDRDPWALLDERAALAAANGITPTAFPDCDRATVDERIEYVYAADGTGAEQDESFSKVLTEKGRQDARTIVLGFMLPYSRVEVERLEIIGPTGEPKPVDVAANSQESIDDSQMEENIYDPNARLLKVGIPNLEVGDVVHAVIKQTIDRPIMPGQSSDENLFESESYIRHLVYEVRSPKGRPMLRKALRSEIQGKVAYSESAGADGGSVLRWEVSDVPRAFEEPSQSSDLETLQRLFVSTTSSWQDVSKWYWSLAEPHLKADSTGLVAETKSLTSGARDEEAKIQALFYYVSREIRYMGLTPEKDRPGFEPHDVKMTFEKKYGVCRDKAALLVAMLRIAGIEAYPVLISVDAKKDAEVPTPDFDHAIVAVARKAGGYELMDPTDEHARQLLPYYDEDRSYLVCRPQGESLRTSPVSPPDENMMSISTTAKLSAGGDLVAKSVMRFGGANDDAYRNAFAGMKEEEQRRFFEARLKLAQPGARLVSLKLAPSSMLDMSTPLSAELEYSVSGLVASGPRVSIASVPWIGKSFGLIDYVIGSAGLDKRKYPMRTDVACGVEESLSITLGDGIALAVYLPKASSIDDDALSYRQEVGLSGNALECRRDFAIKTVELSPDQYLELKNALRAMDRDERESPLLARAAGSEEAPAAAESTAEAAESNARVLDARKTLEVTGPHSAVYKVSYSKLILTYEGKVREAEVKVDYDPACEKVTFLRGTVTAKDGGRQEISPSEINVMDAEWNALAKRYTGGKVLVANLPGVDIGSTVDVAYEVEISGKPFLEGSEEFRLQDGIDSKTFEISAPDGVEVATRVDGPAGAVASASPASSKGRTTLSWSAGRVDPLPSEGSAPPEWSFVPGVDYYVGDFRADLAALNEAMERRAAGQELTAQKARELTAACATDQQRIQAIRDFVAIAVRRAGPYFGELPLGELTAADTTLADRYGHDADRAILLYSMLSSLGFSPEFVLASALPALPRFEETLGAFPSLGDFELPLVRVVVDGRSIYLNDTDQYARLGTTPSEGKLGLESATGRIVEIQAAEGCETESSTEYSLSVSKDGSATLAVTSSYYGALYDRQKRYFAELTPEERSRYFQGLVAKVSQGAKPASGLAADFDSYPGTEKYSVVIDGFAVAEGDYLCFDLPFAPAFLKLIQDRRALPYFIAQRSLQESRLSISYPEGYGEVEIEPGDMDSVLPSGGGEARLSSATAPGGCVLSLRLEADPAIVEPKDYVPLAKIEAGLEQKSTWTFVLKRGGGENAGSD